MIPGTRVLPARPDTDRARTCCRCGLVRQVNRGTRDRLCGSCAEVVSALGEEAMWA